MHADSKYHRRKAATISNESVCENRHLVWPRVVENSVNQYVANTGDTEEVPVSRRSPSRLSRFYSKANVRSNEERSCDCGRFVLRKRAGAAMKWVVNMITPC